MADIDLSEFCPDLHSDIAHVPLRNEARVGEYSGVVYDQSDMLGCYDESGDLFAVMDLVTGKRIWPRAVRETVTYDDAWADAKVYFIQAGSGEIKIGVARDIRDRMRTIQVGSPTKLTLLVQVPGGPREEHAYHRRFAAHRLVGEWFSPHPDILAEIERLTGAPA